MVSRTRCRTTTSPRANSKPASGVLLLLVLALRRGLFDPAMLGGAACAAPDLEHVLPLPRPGGRELYPSHRVEGWHKEGRRSCVGATRRGGRYRRRSDTQTRGVTMPLIRVELFDFRMNDETSAKLIAGLTDALCEATTEGLREHTWVIVEGHSPKNWGVGGVPWPSEKTPGGSAKQ